MKNTSKNIVIIGGNGKTGARVANRLEARNEKFRVVSRSTAVTFDWTDERTWEGALQGAQAAYLTYYPDLSLPGAADQVRGLCQVAVESGVKRIVLMAGRGEPQVGPAEDAVRASGVDFTILECAFFAQNFTEGLLVPQNGVIAFPADQVTEPFIDCDDIADVAVRALLEPGHAGQTYDLTGPRALTFFEATEALARAAGRELSYQPVTFEQYAHALGQDLPPAQVDFFVSLFRFLLDGHNSNTSDDVERLLGRPARSFEQFAQANAGMIR